MATAGFWGNLFNMGSTVANTAAKTANDATITGGAMFNQFSSNMASTAMHQSTMAQMTDLAQKGAEMSLNTALNKLMTDCAKAVATFIKEIGKSAAEAAR